MVLPKVNHSPSLPGVSIITVMEDQKQFIRGLRYLIKSCLTAQSWSREWWEFGRLPGPWTIRQCEIPQSVFHPLNHAMPYHSNNEACKCGDNRSWCGNPVLRREVRHNAEPTIPKQTCSSITPVSTLVMKPSWVVNVLPGSFDGKVITDGRLPDPWTKEEMGQAFERNLWRQDVDGKWPIVSKYDHNPLEYRSCGYQPLCNHEGRFHHFVSGNGCPNNMTALNFVRHRVSGQWGILEATLVPGLTYYSHWQSADA